MIASASLRRQSRCSTIRDLRFTIYSLMPERAIEEYIIAEEPYYLPVDNEIGLFESAHAAHLPVILKGPTGCGKTQFVEHMAWRLERPLITVACHEDLSSTDLV